MLVLNRRCGKTSESEIVVVLPDGRTMSVWLMSAKPGGFSGKLGFDAPDDVKIYRRDLLEEGGTGNVAVPLVVGKSR